MAHLRSVTTEGSRDARTGRPTVGSTVQWDAEIVEAAGRSAGGALEGGVRRERRHRSGSATPRAAGHGGRASTCGTARRAGVPGAVVAKLLGKEPTQQLRDDLRRFRRSWRSARWSARRAARPARPPASRSLSARRAGRITREGSSPCEPICSTGKQVVAVGTWPTDDPQPPRRHREDHVDRHLRVGPAPVQRPHPTMRKGDVLGHEFMGEVVEVGAGGDEPGGGGPCRRPFPIACGVCGACERGLTACCENSNPTPASPRSSWAIRRPRCSATPICSAASRAARPNTSGCRSPISGPSRWTPDLADEKVLFLSDIFPTGYMARRHGRGGPGDVVAVWGAGPVGPVRGRQRVPARVPSGSSRSTASTTASADAGGRGGDAEPTSRCRCPRRSRR